MRLPLLSSSSDKTEPSNINHSWFSTFLPRLRTGCSDLLGWNPTKKCRDRWQVEGSSGAGSRARSSQSQVSTAPRRVIDGATQTCRHKGSSSRLLFKVSPLLPTASNCFQMLPNASSLARQQHQTPNFPGNFDHLPLYLPNPRKPLVALAITSSPIFFKNHSKTCASPTTKLLYSRYTLIKKKQPHCSRS